MITFDMFSKTLKDAVSMVLSGMSGRDKLIVHNTKKEDLIKLHLGWGNEIRNLCGLWQGNNELMKDAGASHPDGASRKIMEAVWEELQKQ